MRPSEKSFEMSEGLDALSALFFGRTRTEAIENDICVSCGGPAVDFNDDLSRADYRITGFCQNCQDDTYN